MKKLFAHIFTICSLITNTCVSQSAEPILNTQPQNMVSEKVVLEYVDFSRIDKAVKKYERLQSKAKWIKRLKYLAISAGCVGVGILIWNYFFKTQNKPKSNQLSAISTNAISKYDELNEKDLDVETKKLGCKEAELRINRLEREDQANKESNAAIGRIKKGSLKALQFVIYTAITASIWTIINKSKDTLENQFNFGGINLDSEFYKQKSAKLNGLIKQLGSFLVQHEQRTQDEHTIKFFDLMFADILINHTTLIRWFEDLIGFIKCMIILNTGHDRLEVACLEKDIISLSTSINQFTDKISNIFNSCSDSQQHANLVDQATTSYLSFCKQFSKFIYDCGLYLYEEDFLQENSSQN